MTECACVWLFLGMYGGVTESNDWAVDWSKFNTRWKKEHGQKKKKKGKKKRTAF